MNELESMVLEDEWLSTILGSQTRKHYRRGFSYLLEFLGLSDPEELKNLVKAETKVIQFYSWLKDSKGLSSNSARSNIIPVQSFFSYIGKPLRLKHRLPQLHAKVEVWVPSLEDLQKIYASGDIAVKAWMSLSRDIPARMQDMMRIKPEQIHSSEFQILSQKESVFGKAFTSQETRDLFKQMEGKVKLPNTSRGIDMMMQKACEVSGMPHRLNQHLWRKLFISKAIDLGISDTVWKILCFKKIPIETLTYFLNGSELRKHWEKIVTAIPLVPKGNGRVGTLEEDGKLFAEALWEVVKPIVEKKRLEKLMERRQRDVVGLIEMEPIPADAKEGLKLFLKLRREGEH